MSTAGGLPAGYRLRPLEAADRETLLQVENRATALYRLHGYPQVADSPIPDLAFLDALFGGAEVLVGVGPDARPVGFAVARPVAGWLHLAELSVDPSHGRKGLGRGLAAAVIARAAEAGHAGVSLTTFRDVPFNAPFYAGLGFAEAGAGEAPGAIADLLAREAPDGVDVSSRVLMLRRNTA